MFTNDTCDRDLLTENFEADTALSRLNDFLLKISVNYIRLICICCFSAEAVTIIVASGSIY